jgi:hypothetical protein
MNTNRTEFVSTHLHVNFKGTIMFSLIVLLALAGCQTLPQTNLVQAASPATPAAVRVEPIRLIELRAALQPTSAPTTEPTPMIEPTPAIEPTPIPTQVKRDGPRYTGVYLHGDSDLGFAVWLPAGWVEAEKEPGIPGVMYLPNPLDPETFLKVEKSQLSTSLQGTDLQAQHQAFIAELTSLPGFELESDETWAGDYVINLDARFTFDHEGLRHKNWIRRFSYGCTQYTLTAQGIDAAEFEYWLPMFYNMIVTIQLSDPLITDSSTANIP